MKERSLVARYNEPKRDGAGADKHRATKSAFIEATLAGTAGLPGLKGMQRS